MKKLFLMIAAVAALFATSCVTDTTTSDVKVAGNECDVTLSIKAPGATSRTIADGLKAVKLTCGVYDADWKYLTTVLGDFDGTSTTTTISMRLVKSKTYNFVFWAQAEGAPYTLTLEGTDNPTIEVDYSNVNANNDSLDAFYGRWACTVNGTINETITLTRPFAQINFGAADMAVAKEFGFDVTSAEATTTVTTMAYTTLSLKTDIASNEEPVTFKAAVLPEDTTLSTNKGDYYWLAMNYILVPGKDTAGNDIETSLAKCDLTVEIPGQVPVVVNVPMAPAKRNWRTNLVGSLLTEQGNLTIEIKPIPVDQYVGVVEVATAEEFNAAFANPEVDFIVLSDNITLTASVTRSTDPKLTVSAGQSLTIDLNNHRLIAESTQLFDVEGTLVIKNGTIENTATDGKVLANNDDAKLSNVTILQSTDSAYFDEQGDKMELIAEGVVKVSEDNYAITAACGLYWFAANVPACNGKTIELYSDITVADDFYPIGYNGGNIVDFTGVFDGNNHTIYNIKRYDNVYAHKRVIGLFSRVNNATIKNLKLEDFVAATYGGEAAALTCVAVGDCTFENLTFAKGSVVAYNNDTAAVVGWANVGNFTFKNITIGADVTIHSLWNSHDTCLGGVIGTLEKPSTVLLEDINIACKLDAYNDVGANYQYGAYRRTGMIIGNMDNTQNINGTTYPDPAAAGVTCKNVTVTYDTWMDYHYCEFKSNGHGSYDDEFTWKCTRVEGSDWGSDPIDTDKCQHESFESHKMCLTVDQLFGGGQGVYGLPAYEGVTVNYPAAYTCPTCGQQHGK